MKKLIFLALGVIFGTNLSAQAAINFQNKSWEALKAEAQQSNKMIFLDAYTTWCAPCKQMDKKVFNKENVAAFFNEHFINVKIDMEKGEGPELARNYGIAAYPTLLFVDENGDAVHRGLGYHDTDQVIQLAKAAMDGSQNLKGLEDKFVQGDRDSSLLMNLTQKSYELRNGSHLKYAEALVDNTPNWENGEKLDFIYWATTGTETKLFDYILKERKTFHKRFGAEEVEAKISELIYLESNLDMQPADLTRLDDLFKKAYPKTAKKESANFKMAYHRQKGEREKFGIAARDYMKYNKTAPAAELNDLAWTFYQVIEDPKLLKQAIKWAKKSIKMSPKGYTYETLASLYEKSGNKEKAIEALEQGISHSNAANEDSRSLEALMEQFKQVQ